MLDLAFIRNHPDIVKEAARVKYNPIDIDYLLEVDRQVLELQRRVEDARTEQNKIMYENQEWVEYLCDRIPLKRPGQPEDLAGPVVFLASESSRYVTGQTLLVDGGISTGAVRALPKSR